MRHPEDRDLALWAGGDLAPAEASRVEAHLAACPACRALADGLRSSRAGLEALGAEAVDPAALSRIRDGVRRRLEDEGGVGWASAHPGAGRARLGGSRWAKAHPTLWALAAALALAALGVGLWYSALDGGAPDGVARTERPEPPEMVRDTGPPPPEDTRETAPVPPPERPRGASREAPPPAPVREAPPEPAGGPEATTPPEPRETPVQRAALAPGPEGPTEPLVIKVVSDDPDIVYYWLVEPEETEDEAVSS